jgi:NADH dehydrogenase
MSAHRRDEVGNGVTMKCDDANGNRRSEDLEPSSAPGVKHVLVLGGGFGGIYAALELEKLTRRYIDVEVTLVTRDNYFLFTPMLPEVAAGELEQSTIINPLRRLLKRVNTFVGTIELIDLEGRQVVVSHGSDGHTHELQYDQLIIALGAGTNFFNLPGVEASSFTIKTLSDAIAIRNQVITQVEEANAECAAGARHPMLTFVVAGGGFAGVETLGGINDFVREAIHFYPNLRTDHLRVVLVSPDNVILPELNPKLGIYAQRRLSMRGIEIITGTRVSAFRDGVVELTNGDKIPTDTLIWTAGAAQNQLLAKLPLPKNNGRVIVDDYLAVAGWRGVWAVGDCALVIARGGGSYHATAQHALREGKVVAHNVIAVLHGGQKRAFHCLALGQLAAIGRRTGVASILGINFSGFIAWWLWRTIYLSKLPRPEKKVRVALDWTLDLCFAKDFGCVAPASLPTRPRRLTRAGGRQISNTSRSLEAEHFGYNPVRYTGCRIPPA